MNKVKIILALVISVMTMFSASAQGVHGLITLKTGEQIEAPEVWFTHGQAVYLMNSKSQKVVIEDPEVDYVQFYDDEKKDFGPKCYAEYLISCTEFLKDNPQMPKKKRSLCYKVFEQDGHILYMIRSIQTDKSGFDEEVLKYYFKKAELPWAAEIWTLRLVKMKKGLKYWTKMFEDNPTMLKKLQENPKEFANSYYANTKGETVNEAIAFMYISLFKDYIETRDKK